MRKLNASSPEDDAALTQAAPTELSDIADSETEAARAWALDDEDDDAPNQRLTPGRITATAVAASFAAIAAAGAVALIYLRDGGSMPVPAITAPTTATSAAALSPAPASPPAPAALPEPAGLEGVDEKFIAEMRGFAVPIADNDPRWTIDLAHAVCATARMVSRTVIHPVRTQWSSSPKG